MVESINLAFLVHVGSEPSTKNGERKEKLGRRSAHANPASAKGLSLCIAKEKSLCNLERESPSRGRRLVAARTAGRARPAERAQCVAARRTTAGELPLPSAPPPSSSKSHLP